MAGRFGESPMVGTAVCVAVFTLPSIGALCVMLNVSVSWWVSDTVGVVKSRDAPARMLSPSSMVISWMPTAERMPAFSAISVSGDSSEARLSPLMSSGSVVEFWCLIDGRLRALAVGVWSETGGKVGERVCGGGSGVVGDVGWDVASKRLMRSRPTCP